MEGNLIHDRSLRGHTQLGWLDSYHTFSFGQFRDPERMGFRSLRVINDDRVVPGGGFATHSHRDMEIFTYVVDGKLEHRDSLGNGAVIQPGEAQIMSAGTGITHSEFNHSQTEPVHFLQIWIVPNQRSLPPRYEQRDFSITERKNQLHLIAAKDGRDGAVRVFQDIDLYTAVMDEGNSLIYEVPPNRFAWLQIVRGIATLNDRALREGDGVQVDSGQLLDICSSICAEILLFDLA